MKPDPDYVVIRAGDGLAVELMPPKLEGTWVDRSTLLTPDHVNILAGSRHLHLVAVPTGRFESRDDGAVAEVWEVRP